MYWMLWVPFITISLFESGLLESIPFWWTKWGNWKESVHMQSVLVEHRSISVCIQCYTICIYLYACIHMLCPPVAVLPLYNFSLLLPRIWKRIVLEGTSISSRKTCENRCCNPKLTHPQVDTNTDWFYHVLSILLHWCLNLSFYRLNQSWIIICCELNPQDLPPSIFKCHPSIPSLFASIPPGFYVNHRFLLVRIRCLAAKRVWRRDSMFEAKFSRFEEPAFRGCRVLVGRKSNGLKKRWFKR